MATTTKRSRGRPRAFNPKPEQITIQSLDRAMRILKVLADGEGLSLTELSEAAEEAPATVYRVLSTFAAHGIVEVEAGSQLWFVGQEAFRIGSAFLGRTNLVEQARVVMHALMAETGETANLAIADGGQVVFISQVETHEPIRAFFRPGTRGPIHASGIGKALLAYLPEERIEQIIREQGLAAFTSRTLTDPARLRAELAAIRTRGWAMDDEERTEGMRCVAAPIFNAFREATAGVSVSGPTGRMSRAEDGLGVAVRTAADRITRAIGGTPPEEAGSSSDEREVR